MSGSVHRSYEAYEIGITDREASELGHILLASTPVTGEVVRLRRGREVKILAVDGFKLTVQPLDAKNPIEVVLVPPAAVAETPELETP